MNLTVNFSTASLLLAASLVLSPLDIEPTSSAFTDSASANATLTADKWVVDEWKEEISFYEQPMGTRFTWVPVGGYATYDVKSTCRLAGSQTPDPGNTYSATVTGTQWTIPLVASRTKECFWQIRAVGSPGSTWSPEYQFYRWISG